MLVAVVAGHCVDVTITTAQKFEAYVLPDFFRYPSSSTRYVGGKTADQGVPRVVSVGSDNMFYQCPTEFKAQTGPPSHEHP